MSMINKKLIDSLQSLIEIIYTAGLINIDFADLKTIFEGRGKLTYLNSIEITGGQEKEVIEKVINSPLYPYNIEGAKGVLFDIAGRKNVSLAEVNQISRIICDKVNQEAKIIFGVSGAKSGFGVKVTVLATGCSKKLFPGKARRKIKIEKKKETVKKQKPPVKKIKARRIKRKKTVKPAVKSPAVEEKTLAKEEEKATAVVRKNALAIKRDIEKEEAEILAKESIWEAPSFLRRKIN